MKYIFLDIDGTLFDHSTFRIPQSAYKAVELAKAAGHRIFICTGRSCCMLDHVNQVNYDGVVAAAGAYVETQGKILYEECIDNVELQQFLSYCRKYGVNYILEGNKGVYMDAGIREYFQGGEGKQPSMHNFFKQKMVYGEADYDPEAERIYKFCLYASEPDSLPKVEEQVSEQFHFVYGTTNEEHPLFNAEVTLEKNNKATGIEKILDYYGGSKEDTLAAGDSMNDLEMLQECHIGIAMGNADERLKPYADYITADIGDDGIYKAFEHYGLLA